MTENCARLKSRSDQTTQFLVSWLRSFEIITFNLFEASDAELCDTLSPMICNFRVDGHGDSVLVHS